MRKLIIALCLCATPAAAQYQQPHNYMQDQYNASQERAQRQQEQSQQNQWRENQNRRWGHHYGEDEE